MKVVVVGTRGFPGVQGGVERHGEQLYPRLAARGCAVVVFTRRPYVDRRMNVFQGVRLVDVPCPKQKFLEAIAHTALGVIAAWRERPDVLHVHALGPALCVPLARLLGLRVVMTHHGPDYRREKWGRIARAVLRLGEAWGLRWSHRVIAISRTSIDHAAARCEGRLTIIPNGVPPAEPAAETEALQRCGLSPRRYVLAVGRLVPEKGFHDLIEAFLQARAEAPEALEGWKLAIVGSADHEDVYSRSVREQGSRSPDVVFTGFLSGEPLRQLFTHAGLFVLPSSYEGLPIALLEAMSYGLPCAASNLPVHREVGLPPERLFEPGDRRRLAQIIVRCAAAPLSAEERLEQARRVVRDYDWERIADQTLAVYQALAAPKSWPPAVGQPHTAPPSLLPPHPVPCVQRTGL